MLVQTLIANFVVMQHPYIFAAVLLLWSFYPQFPFHVLYFVLYVVPRSIVLGVLTCLGFERGGVRSGEYILSICRSCYLNTCHIYLHSDSIASRYQARRYGEATPSGGIFARAQSYGAVDHESLSPPVQRSHPVVTLLWRFLALLCLYASLVVLLKYGD